MGTKRAERKENTNPSVDRKYGYFELRCPICSPNRGCNSKRKGKHGSSKPRHKDKRG